MLAIRYQKDIRTGPKQIVSRVNVRRPEDIQRLTRAKEDLEAAKTRNDIPEIQQRMLSVQFYEKVLKNSPEKIEIDTGIRTLDATIYYNPKDGKFYYDSLMESGDTRVKKNTTGSIKIHESFPNSWN